MYVVFLTVFFSGFLSFHFPPLWFSCSMEKTGPDLHRQYVLLEVRPKNPSPEAKWSFGGT